MPPETLKLPIYSRDGKEVGQYELDPSAIADRVNRQDSAGILLGDLAIDVGFPAPLGTTDGRIPIFRPNEANDRAFDGMLGQAWFADRIWTLDYVAQKLQMHKAAPAGPVRQEIPG